MMQHKHRRNYKRLQMLMGVLAGGLVSTYLMPVLAADKFDNDGIQFDVDTVVDFTFVESNGAFQSTFGVLNLDTGEKTPLLVEVKPSDNPQDLSNPSDYKDDTDSENRNDFYGSPGNTVPQPLAEFEFKVNTRYAFYLESSYNGRPAGILYSTNVQNSNSRRQTKFEGDPASLANGGMVIAWDDTGIVKSLQEQDFDDFIIRVGGHVACPYTSNATDKQQLKEQRCN